METTTTTTMTTTTNTRRNSRVREKILYVRNEDDRVTAIETLKKLTRLEEQIDEKDSTDLDMLSRSVRAYQTLCSRIQDLRVDTTLRERIDRAVSLSERLSTHLCNSIKLLEKKEEQIESPKKQKSILLHGSGSG